jgi:hypothetical protein
MKMIYEKNPYREFVDINKEILTKDINEVLKAKYSLSN